MMPVRNLTYRRYFCQKLVREIVNLAGQAIIASSETGDGLTFHSAEEKWIGKHGSEMRRADSNKFGINELAQESSM